MTSRTKVVTVANLKGGVGKSHLATSLGAAAQMSGIQTAILDIDADPDLQRRFTDDVPVILVNGREAFRYRKRHEQGTQHPLDTLQTKSGTCRDYALFMIEALRRLGIAARFVSGYLFVHRHREYGYIGDGSTHAWVQVYLPSAGWIEFDPTNGIIGTRDLIRVAVARDPRQAIPLHGAYLGSPDAFAGMEVHIRVVSVGDEPHEAPQAEKV